VFLAALNSTGRDELSKELPLSGLLVGAPEDSASRAGSICGMYSFVGTTTRKTCNEAGRESDLSNRGALSSIKGGRVSLRSRVSSAAV